jgi:hypothetical protein
MRKKTLIKFLLFFHQTLSHKHILLMIFMLWVVEHVNLTKKKVIIGRKTTTFIFDLNYYLQLWFLQLNIICDGQFQWASVEID